MRQRPNHLKSVNDGFPSYLGPRKPQRIAGKTIALGLGIILVNLLLLAATMAIIVAAVVIGIRIAT